MSETNKSVESAVTFEVTAKVQMRDLFTEDQVEQVEDLLDALRSGDDGAPYGVVDCEEFSKALEASGDEELPPTVQVTLGMVVEHCKNNAATVINFI